MNMNRWGGAVVVLSLTVLSGVRADEALPAAKVPAPVLAAVQTRYANARQVAWSKEREAGAVQYEVKLVQAATHLEVTLDPSGKVLSEETEIEFKAAPAAVQKAFADSKYGAWTLHKVEQIADGQDATKLTFEIAADHSSERIEVVFDPSGKQLFEELHHKKK